MTRLVTFVDVDAGAVDDGQISLSARHEGVLTNGGRVLLLDDRGWSTSPSSDDWVAFAVEDIEKTARTVVGPDEPFDNRLQKDMEADHWAHLAKILSHQGIDVDASELARLPHEVKLGQQLLRRLGQ